jgi:hypothetical protein
MPRKIQENNQLPYMKSKKRENPSREIEYMHPEKDVVSKQAISSEGFDFRTAEQKMEQVKGRDDACLFKMALDWSSVVTVEAHDLLGEFKPMEDDLLQGKWLSFLKMKDEWLM